MKLRIKGDSLRLRLTQGEVTALDTGGVVEEKVRFGGGAALIYRLRRDCSGQRAQRLVRTGRSGSSRAREVSARLGELERSQDRRRSTHCRGR